MKNKSGVYDQRENMKNKSAEKPTDNMVGNIGVYVELKGRAGRVSLRGSKPIF